MFEKGEYIIYGTTGVCEVVDVTSMKMEGIPKDSTYYILRPYGQAGSKIFVSVNNQKTIMRRTLTEEEAQELIEEIPYIGELWIENDKLREEQYKNCIRSCQCTDWVKIIKTLYLRKEERLAQGKKITATDERYLRAAEDYLYAELSLTLGVPKEEMEQYITDRIEQMQERETMPQAL